MHTSPCKGRWWLENAFVRKGIAVAGPKDVQQFGEERLDILHDASGQIASERRDFASEPAFLAIGLGMVGLRAGSPTDANCLDQPRSLQRIPMRLSKPISSAARNPFAMGSGSLHDFGTPPMSFYLFTWR